MTAEGAIRMIRQRQLSDLSILDICCGVGIIGLTVFSRLNKEGLVKEVAFAAINIFNLHSLAKTLTHHLGSLLGNRIKYWLSDGLKHIPRDQKFDLILSNPPHYFNEPFCH
jgi:16S rRNA G1207 methylase RsmC